MDTVIYKELKQYGSVKQHEPLSKHTTFKIGGPADFFVIVEKTADLVNVLKYADGEGLPYVFLGGGSNMLVNDDGFRGIVIRIKTNEKRVEDSSLFAEAGCSTVEIAQFSISHGLTGFEWGVGVPGTIGGAVRGNAGAMGGRLSDVVSAVDVYQDGEVAVFSNEDCLFGYRDSIFKHSGGVVLSATVALQPSEDKRGMKKALEHLQYRNKTQPKGYASTGCIFKNPDFEENKERLYEHFDEHGEKVRQFARVGKISAGWLVEQAGLKGESCGSAAVSQEHGNFIVNKGGAKAAEVLALIERIRGTVYHSYGIALEEEIHII